MPLVRPSAYLYTSFTIALWAVLLPAVLIRDQGPGIPLRPLPLLLVAGVVLVVGTALVHYPGRQLASAGVGLFGMTPGRALVTGGWYGRVRNPIDIGTTLVAVAAWAAFDVKLMWVVPSAALINFAVAAGLYEDRRLFEAFGEDFTAYRRRVGKWIP